MNPAELKEFLDYKHDFYNRQHFIETDPILIPHQFTKKEDIEMAAFLSATIAWGQRKTILSSANRLMKLMEFSPYDFIMNSSLKEKAFSTRFVHRTFNQDDLLYFWDALRYIYEKQEGMQQVFERNYRQTGSLAQAIIAFRTAFLSLDSKNRASKHVSDIARGSAGKRLNMFLRWMVRKDKRGVDFGLWDGIPMQALYLPLDLHTGNVSRKLGLLTRKQSDWKAVEEVTNRLREMDPTDPIKYDFALFGLGVFEKF